MAVGYRQGHTRQDCPPGLTRAESFQTVKGELCYDTGDGTETINFGDAVEIKAGHTAGGVVGNVYEALVDRGSIDLAAENFAAAANWRSRGTVASFNAQKVDATSLVVASIPDDGADTCNIHRKTRFTAT